MKSFRTEPRETPANGAVQGAYRSRTGVSVRTDGKPQNPCIAADSADDTDSDSRLLVGDELGWRLAGFADGEGHFGVHKVPGKPNCHCVFVIGMRADDRAVLELFSRSTGLGRIFDITPTHLSLARRPGTKPQAHWSVARKADCVALAALFDRYPPVSKKAGDFAIWREAVAAWQRGDQRRLRELRVILMDSRAYPDSTIAQSAEFADPQLGIDGMA